MSAEAEEAWGTQPPRREGPVCASADTGGSGFRRAEHQPGVESRPSGLPHVLSVVLNWAAWGALKLPHKFPVNWSLLPSGFNQQLGLNVTPLSG